MYLDHFFAHHIHLKNDVKDDFTHRFSELHTTKEEKKAMYTEQKFSKYY
jgi:hypothetical protein